MAELAHHADYNVQIDWKRNGNWGAALNDITRYVMSINTHIGFREAFQSLSDEMTLNVTLNNADRRFSPENSLGPYYAMDWLMRPIRLVAIYAGTSTTLWEGWTTGIQVDWNPNGAKRAVISAQGPRVYLQKATVNFPLKRDQTANSIIAYALEKSVQFPPAVSTGPWALGVPGYSELGTTTYLQYPKLLHDYIAYAATITPESFPFVGDTWGDGISVLEIMRQAVVGSRSRFYFDRTGYGILIDRAEQLTNTTVKETFSDRAIGMVYQYGQSIVNVCRVRYKSRKTDTGVSTLWELDKEFTLKAGDTRKIRARFSEQGSDSKVAGLDIERPSLENGTLAFSSGNGDLQSWTELATGVEFTVRALTECTVSTIIIRGKKLTTYNVAEVEAMNGESMFKFGRRELVLTIDLLDNPDRAQMVADYEVDRRSNAKGDLVSITLMNSTPTRMEQMLRLTMFDRIRISETQTGHAGDYFIVGEDHSINEALKVHKTTWTLEPADTRQYWILGREGYSELGETTIVGPF